MLLELLKRDFREVISALECVIDELCCSKEEREDVESVIWRIQEGRLDSELFDEE